MEKARIIIVEDEAILAEFYRTVLVDYGYNVVAMADSGEDAISVALAHKPDLILMDIILKGEMDGVQAAQVITKTSDVPIIFATAYSKTSMLDKAKKVCPYGYLVKPFDEKELRAAIEMGLYKYSMEKKLRKSQSRFRSILESISDGFLVLETDDLVISYFNKAAEKLLNRTEDDVLNQSIFEAFPEFKGSVFELNFRKAYTEKQFINFESYFGVSPYANWYDVRVHPGEKSISIYFEVTTKRKKIEEQLRQSEKMQAIGQLAGGIAHDFNNQLVVIMGFAELAKKMVDDNSKTAFYINNIISGALHSADLTKKMLAFARKGKYIITMVNINETISEVASILKHSIEKNIIIKTDLQAEPSTVSGDVSQLENAVLNIALNARDAMPDGGELSFSSSVVTIDQKYINSRNYIIKPGEYLKICISDTGTGMDKKTMDHIFEPFFTTKPQGKGTGMGMASVYGTVKSHSGSIEVESTPNKGTSISLFLPSVSGAVLKKEISEVPTVKQGSRILIIDDEESVAASLKMTLVSEGYLAVTSNSGKEAIKIYQDSWKNIDLIILDMIMPELSGQETFFELKKINPDVKVILLSGYSLTKEIKSIMKDGAKAYIQKPVLKKDLVSTISGVLSYKKA
ncbi:MAG: response regulator [Fibrobacteria bacterium]|nr:response regulator [Fibrobacteria bacterium]